MVTGLVNKISYFDGKKKRSISEAHLKDIRSRVVTHEGETLRGREGQRYQEKYGKSWK